MPAATDSARRHAYAWPLAALTAAYGIVLVFATHYPKPEDLLGPNPPSDKTLHFVAYGLLGAMVSASLAAAGRWSVRTAAATLVGLAAFAAIDEATQPLFGRHADVLDWVYDLVGLAAGLAVAAVAARFLASPRT